MSDRSPPSKKPAQEQHPEEDKVHVAIMPFAMHAHAGGWYLPSHGRCSTVGKMNEEREESSKNVSAKAAGVVRQIAADRWRHMAMEVHWTTLALYCERTETQAESH